MKFINRAVEKADMMLKLLRQIMITINIIQIQNHIKTKKKAETGAIRMPDGTEEDLVTILTVKGASKQEKADCLEEFRANEQ